MLNVACSEHATHQASLMQLMYKTPASLLHQSPASLLWKKYTREMKMEPQSETRGEYELSNHLTDGL